MKQQKLYRTLKAHDIEGETTTINFLWGEAAKM